MSAKAKQEVSKSPRNHRIMTRSELALESSVNAATVIDGYQKNLNGPEVDIVKVIEGLRETCKTVKAGDLSDLEAMLIGQAKALETMFTSLTRRSQGQDQLKHYVTFLTLALKAQSQSRATIQAVVDLKYPRQISFVRQANISHGHQQVNNGPNCDDVAKTDPRAEEKQFLQNKLLEGTSDERAQVDTGAKRAAGRRYQTVEAVGKVNGTDQC